MKKLEESVVSVIVDSIKFTKVMATAADAVKNGDFKTAEKFLSKAEVLKEKIGKDLNSLNPGKGDEFIQEFNTQMDSLYDTLEDLKSGN